MKIKDLPKHLRPREKLISKGVENLKDEELLAILLRTGNKNKNAIEISKSIMNKYKKKNFLNLNYIDFVKVDGIDSSKACTILSAMELAKRAMAVQDSLPNIIQSTHDTLNLLSELKNLRKEHFVAIYLNARNQLIRKEVISIGTVNTSLVHPREVFEPAVSLNAVQIIVAHNHPSGDVNPSEADVETTDKLIAAGELMGIDVVDHLIISTNGYFSFRENNLI